MTILLCSIVSFSQNNISGIIKNTQGEALVGASVIVRSCQDILFHRECVSKESGVFELQNIPSASYNIEISCMGYSQYTLNLELYESVSLGNIILKEKNQNLDEVVVKGDTRIEKSDKVILIPTALEKEHAVNGFDLLSIMQIPDLDISSDAKNISTVTGGEIVVCINGMEVQQEELSTLLSKNIQKIEYVRTPSGKYVGKAGMINITIKQIDFGGNLYLSANQGLVYKNGDYTAFTDFTKKKITFSLTASGGWSRNSSYTEGTEQFRFADGKELLRKTNNNNSLCRENNQAIKFKIVSIGEKYKFNSFITLTRQEQPGSNFSQSTSYTGSIETMAEKDIHTSGKNLSPYLYANYSISLPNNQDLNITGVASWGKNEYSSLYNETGQVPIESVVDENNYGITGNIVYTKSFKNNIGLSINLYHNHMAYKDVYSGSSTGIQKLSTDVSQGDVQISQSGKQYFYYASVGLSNSAIILNGIHYNYCHPIAFYGGNFAFNNKHSLNLNGYYSHTLFEPSNKNSMVVPISFFESVKGNPDIKPLRAFGNIISYNGQWGNFLFNASYNSYMYFDNMVHYYFADNDRIYNTIVNDGVFYGNMLTATFAYKAFDDKLRLSVTAIEEYNMIRGEIYDLSKNILRARLSVTYLCGDWMIKFNYRTPYKALDIRMPYFVTNQSVYELQVGWNHKAWSVEVMVRNPFNKYDKTHITMDYGYYNEDMWNFSEPKGCNVSLKLSYSFSYGKKSDRGDIEIEKSTKSAILKSY